jgi:hypothetical protein
MFPLERLLATMTKWQQLAEMLESNDNSYLHRHIESCVCNRDYIMPTDTNDQHTVEHTVHYKCLEYPIVNDDLLYFFFLFPCCATSGALGPL